MNHKPSSPSTLQTIKIPRFLTDPIFTPAFEPLPLGSARPRGWLLRQLRLQADGLTGHLDEFWPCIRDSRWIGGEAEGWERGPYWLDGLIPLAVLLGDETLLAKAERWVNEILARQHDDGWLGAKDDPHEGSGQHTLDPWPLAIVFKAFIQWHEATGLRGESDARIVPAMGRALKRIDTLLDEHPLENWAKMRWFEIALACLWLHEQTDEEWLLDLARKTRDQGYNWAAHFADFQWVEKPKERSWSLESHGPNHAMALKEPAIRARFEGQTSARGADLKCSLEILDRFHGQVTGIFSNDECLAGLSPSQGAETCSVVEAMFSLEESLAVFGDAFLGDRLERLAFNALPAPFSPDMWARQYDQQVNQVLVSRAPRPFVSNGECANLYSLEGEFGCCTANMHQGWPKFAKSLWMRSPDGLVALSFAPCHVECEVGGAQVQIEVESNYPFEEEVLVRLSVDRPTTFALELRIPGWAQNATLCLDDGSKEALAHGTFHVLKREWSGETILRLHLPMQVRVEPRPNNAVSISRGPLVFALPLGEKWTQIGGELPHADWEVCPTTPWNYALELERGIQVVQNGVNGHPFSVEGAPLRLEVRGRRVPHWTLEQNCAAPPPQSPVATNEPPETLSLIPFGCTNLRVAEFPTCSK